jgi:hypothetical protein
MAQKKTTNLLPNKFKTAPNIKFINSTVEPLISEPETRRINGYIGQHITRSYRIGDSYVQESSTQRQNYQLDPTLIVYDTALQKIKDTVGYTQLLDKLRYLGNDVANESLLFEQQYYNYYPHFDPDKFINYSQYYWVPTGMTSIIIEDTITIDIVNDILGKINYTSANGVVFTNSMVVKFNTLTEPAEYQNREYYVECVGTGIRLVAVDSLVTPETFLSDIGIPYDIDLVKNIPYPYDVGAYDVNLSFPVDPEYLTINRADQSLNAWSRGNRWVHLDAIQAVKQYQGIEIDFTNYRRAKRPIIEFDPDIALFNHGVNFYAAVDLMDTTTEDPLSDLVYTGFQNALSSRLIDSKKAETGFTVIFTAALDPDVRNKVFTIRIGYFGATLENRFNLTKSNRVLLDNSNMVIKDGPDKGKSYIYKNGVWSLAQQKTQLNQPPLFDLFDQNGVSYSDTDYYPSSTFIGNKLFCYQLGTGVKDAALGFPLSYRNIGNIGDIQFKDFVTTDTFSYQSASNVSTSTGQVQINGQLTNSWALIPNKSFQRQIFEFMAVDSKPYKIDIQPNNGQSSVQVNVNGLFLKSNEFVYNSTARTVTFINDLLPGDSVSILVHSDQASAKAYYEVPINLINNSDNQDISTATLGQIRNHVTTQYGISNGVDSVRDFVKPPVLPGTILKHSSPLTPAMFFLTSDDFDFVASVDQARNSYSFFKKRFLDAATNLGTLDFDNIPGSVDTVLDYVSQNFSPDMPYYYSDMTAHGDVLSKTTYIVYNTSQRNYGIESIFNNTVPSSRSVLVYNREPDSAPNDWVQLTLGQDYVINTVQPSITMLRQLTYSSILEIRDYASTDGSYIPETPTKMGMWPSTRPEIRMDNSFRNVQSVIVGHDGSKTIAFGDFRDAMLLELELRIYNNIKCQYEPALLDWHEICPGAFRSTGYQSSQINQLLAPYYYRWKAENNLELMSTNVFKNSDPWTWNYYNQLARDNSRLNGSWTALFQYWYDTVEPLTRPWEMLGYTNKPAWWDNKYGAAPYTAGNGVLWDDIRDGVQTDINGISSQVNPLFARPNIYDYLPIDDQGNPRTPVEIFVKMFNGAITKSNYVFGMGDIIENSWRRSSDFPFVVQIAMAVLKPARYFAQYSNIG